MKYGKLTEKKVKYIVRHKRKGTSNKEIAFEMRVSPSTVNRVWFYWLSHHEYHQGLWEAESKGVEYE